MTTFAIGRLYAISEVAEMLDVSRSTVRRYVKDGQLGHFRFPTGTIRVAGAHVEQFLGAEAVAEAERVLAEGDREQQAASTQPPAHTLNQQEGR
jgi:excisionase family DNA binding protein